MHNHIFIMQNLRLGIDLQKNILSYIDHIHYIPKALTCTLQSHRELVLLLLLALLLVSFLIQWYVHDFHHIHQYIQPRIYCIHLSLAQFKRLKRI